MAMDDDVELLQDFLVEAGEILEQLNEQLVDLEQRPDDTELLNAVFRGFHTIKGGGSFLSLTALVDVCHRAEDVFNALRNGERKVDAQLMDVILPVIDVVNTQFDEIRSGNEPTAADPALIAQLEALLKPGETASAEEIAVPDETPEDSLDAEFEAIIDAAQTTKTPAEGSATESSDEITGEEFEALLDQLHGTGTPAEKNEQIPVQSSDSESSDNDSEISEDEFEALLDQLHGGGAPSAAKKNSPSPASKKPVDKAADDSVVAPEPKSAPVVEEVKATEKASELGLFTYL